MVVGSGGSLCYAGQPELTNETVSKVHSFIHSFSRLEKQQNKQLVYFKLQTIPVTGKSQSKYDRHLNCHLNCTGEEQKVDVEVKLQGSEGCIPRTEK